MKKIDYDDVLVRVVSAYLYTTASFADNDLRKLQEKKPTNLTFVRLLRDRLYNEIIGANENSIGKDSLPNNLEKLLFMRDIFKSYDENFLVNLGNIISETGKFVKRLDKLVSSFRNYRKINKGELEYLRNLCKTIERVDESRYPSFFDESRMGLVA